MQAESKGWRRLGLGLLITSSYVLSAKVGLTFAIIGKAVSPVWPPAGVALAAMLLAGISYWPFLFLGCVLTMLCVDASLWAVIPISIATTLEATLGALALHKLTGTRNPFEAGKHVFWFLTVAVFAAAFCAIVGSLSLITIHMASTLFSTAFYTWCLGDVAGIVILTPLIISFVGVKERPFSPKQKMEFSLVFLLLVLANATVFTSLQSDWSQEVPSVLLLIPWLLWISMRFGVRGSSLASFILFVFSTYGTSRGYGPFVRPSPHQSLIFVQLFIITVSLSALVVSSVMTEKDRIHQKLVESQEKLRAIFNHSFQHIGLISPQGKVISASQSALEFVNSPWEEVEGKLYWNTPFWRVFEDTRDRDRVLRAMMKASHGHFTRLEVPLIDSQGERKVFDVSFKPVFTQSGKIEYVIPEGRDITDLKVSQETTRKQATLLNAVIEGTTDAVYAKDADGRYLLINTAGATLLGKTVSEVIGRTDHDLFFKETAEQIIARDRAVIASGKGATYEETCTAPNGSRHYLASKGPIYDDSGKLLGLVGISRDISERKQMELELRRSNIELEHFAYIASHDLQEPLRMVIAHLQLLERKMGDNIDADSRDFMNYAIDGARRMRDLINDLLAYSRVARREISYQPVDCNAVLSRVLFSLKDAIQESGAAVSRQPLPAILCDGERISQLFQNLLGNAMKYRRNDILPQIDIGAELGDEGWKFWVRDNGIGIDAAFQERIFSMFQRLHSREQYPGTGIGLAICKKVVEQHGGRLWVESSPGDGSTFYFIIPDRAVASPPPVLEVETNAYA